jgi:hypothetical protein
METGTDFFPDHSFPVRGLVEILGIPESTPEVRFRATLYAPSAVGRFIGPILFFSSRSFLSSFFLKKTTPFVIRGT